VDGGFEFVLVGVLVKLTLGLKRFLKVTLFSRQQLHLIELLVFVNVVVVVTI
jgi:hypothetical protein